MTVGSTNVAHGITPATFQRIQASWRGSRPSDPFPYSESSALFEPSKAQHFPLEAGDELLRMPPDTEVDAEMKFHFDIAFGESQVVQGEPLIDTVESLAKAVSNTITRLAVFL